MGTPGAEVNSTVADPEEGAASAPPPPAQGPKNKETTIFRPKYCLECVI